MAKLNQQYIIGQNLLKADSNDTAPGGLYMTNRVPTVLSKQVYLN